MSVHPGSSRGDVWNISADYLPGKIWSLEGDIYSCDTAGDKTSVCHSLLWLLHQLDAHFSASSHWSESHLRGTLQSWSPPTAPVVHIHHPCRGPSCPSNTWSRAPFLQTLIQSLHASLEVDLQPWNVHARSVTVVTHTLPSSLIFCFLSNFHDFKGACSVLTHTRCSAWAWFSFSALIVRRHFFCIMEGYANHLQWLIWLFKTLAYWCEKRASYFCFKVRVCAL